MELSFFMIWIPSVPQKAHMVYYLKKVLETSQLGASLKEVNNQGHDSKG